MNLGGHEQNSTSSLPTIQFDNELLTVKFDGGGLIILRKNAAEHENALIALPPEEANLFTMIYMMAQVAAQVGMQHSMRGGFA